jgi:dTDP-4-amino-4,6-dideoxygalactose transaminase
MQFPFLDLKAQFANIRGEIMAAVAEVLEQQHFILGPEVEKLEQDIAQLVDSRFAIGCASGSDALLLALMAVGIDAGDEVITTPYTFGATGGAIVRLKARPVFVDIDPQTYNLDPRKLAKAITPRTRAIIPVHLFGLSAEMKPILEIARTYNLPIIEDAAQAIGAWHQGRPVGSLGTMACFSFFPSKNLGGAGDGGMITTNDPDLDDRLKVLRVHGCRHKYQYEMVGANSRLDALQAAILRTKLRYLYGWTEARRQNAMRYRKLFSEFGLQKWVEPPAAPENCIHVYNQFVIRARRRDALRAHLRYSGIPTEIYYPSPLHLEPAYTFLGYKPGNFPHAEQACKQTLALPIFAELTEAQQRAVVAAIADFYYSGSKDGSEGIDAG